MGEETNLSLLPAELTLALSGTMLLSPARSCNCEFWEEEEETEGEHFSHIHTRGDSSMFNSVTRSFFELSHSDTSGGESLHFPVECVCVCVGLDVCSKGLTTEALELWLSGKPSRLLILCLTLQQSPSFLHAPC